VKDEQAIIIQQNIPTTDPDLPGSAPSWQTYCIVWAELQIGSGREYFGAKRVNAALEGLIFTRQFIAGITPDMRVKCSYGYLEISAVIEQRHLGRVELQIGKRLGRG
jgi:head-tail adaptor